MFNNYQELFYGCVEFYKTSFHYGPTSDRLMGTIDTAPLFKANFQQRRVKPLASDQTDVSVNDSASPQQQFLDSSAIRDGNTHVDQASASLEANPSSSGVNIAAEAQAGDMNLADPRLLIEANGTRLVRVGSFNGLDMGDFVCIGTIFIILFLAKRLLSHKLAKFKQIEQLALRPKDRERLDESLWRLLYYSFSSIWLIYCCLAHNSHLLLTSRPKEELKYEFHLYWPTYAIFMIEAAFYLHATYALVFEDVWRRDSPMMFLHHVAAIFATLSIYATRLHQIGLISTVLRDTCDVLLELTKLTKCLHIQDGRRVKAIGRLVNCFLSVFAFAFALNQLYYYPLFCLYHGLHVAKLYSIQSAVMMGIIACGLIFLLLDLLWFGLILRLLYYMALAKPMKDLREYDDEDDDIVESEQSERKTGQRARSSNDDKEKRD